MGVFYCPNGWLSSPGQFEGAGQTYHVGHTSNKIVRHILFQTSQRLDYHTLAGIKKNRYEYSSAQTDLLCRCICEIFKCSYRKLEQMTCLMIKRPAAAGCDAFITDFCCLFPRQQLAAMLSTLSTLIPKISFANQINSSEFVASCIGYWKEGTKDQVYLIHGTSLLWWAHCWRNISIHFVSRENILGRP